MTFTLSLFFSLYRKILYKQSSALIRWPDNPYQMTLKKDSIPTGEIHNILYARKLETATEKTAMFHGKQASYFS